MLPAPSLGKPKRGNRRPTMPTGLSSGVVDQAKLETLMKITSLSGPSITSAVVTARLCGLNTDDIIALAEAGIFTTNRSEWTAIRSMYFAANKKPQDTASYLAAGLDPSEIARLRASNSLTPEALQTLIMLRKRDAGSPSVPGA